MEEDLKRIRDYEQISAFSQGLSILVDGDELLEGDFKRGTIEQLLTFLIANIDTSSLKIYLLKPVLSVVNTLPSSNMLVGDRYFILTGGSANSIAEWGGASWNYTPTQDGEIVFVHSVKNFLVRTSTGYVYSDPGRVTLEVPFTDDTSIEITHNLNKYPMVMAIDSSGRELIIQTQFNNRNQCTVSWTGSTSGTIILN